MSKVLLLTLAVSMPYFTANSLNNFYEELQAKASQSIIPPIKSPVEDSVLSTGELKDLLHAQAPTLSEPVINKVVISLKCANKFNLDHNNILTVIDYSLPSSEKRLWVFDLKQKKLLFYTYVAHGIKSGTLLTNYFSNKYNSKASSIGIYKTEKAYYGREGLSLRLDGLDRSFNDNASNRSVVMHGGWYVEEQFIKKYGRAGRSWGCPAVPLNLYQSIIKTIKDNSILVVYYPSEDWFAKSKFLNCQKVIAEPNKVLDFGLEKPIISESEQRDAVLMADLRGGYKGEEGRAILAMSADNYERIFHSKAPLARMLRRQINNMEYIALSNDEFNSIFSKGSLVVNAHNEVLNTVYFVIPVIIMVRGYYETQMRILNMGKIKEVRLNSDALSKQYTVFFEKKPALTLRSTDQFIRWLGL